MVQCFFIHCSIYLELVIFHYTQACGTGACATAVAGVVRGKTKRKTKVIMDGGPLTIEWDERSGKVFMTGGAVNVFEGFIKV